MSRAIPPRAEPLRWWHWGARRRTRVQCQHLHADGIYGDEINAVGGKRGYCWSCRTYLDKLPYSFGETGDRRLMLGTLLPANCGFCLEPWADHSELERQSCLDDLRAEN